jgi:hypothetical protein
VGSDKCKIIIKKVENGFIVKIYSRVSFFVQPKVHVAESVNALKNIISEFISVKYPESKKRETK